MQARSQQNTAKSHAAKSYIGTENTCNNATQANEFILIVIQKRGFIKINWLFPRKATINSINLSPYLVEDILTKRSMSRFGGISRMGRKPKTASLF